MLSHFNVFINREVNGKKKSRKFMGQTKGKGAKGAPRGRLGPDINLFRSESLFNRNIEFVSGFCIVVSNPLKPKSTIWAAMVL